MVEDDMPWISAAARDTVLLCLLGRLEILALDLG
jgi:hypothetical protein